MQLQESFPVSQTPQGMRFNVMSFPVLKNNFEVYKKRRDDVLRLMKGAGQEEKRALEEELGDMHRMLSNMFEEQRSKMDLAHLSPETAALLAEMEGEVMRNAGKDQKRSQKPVRPVRH